MSTRGHGSKVLKVLLDDANHLPAFNTEAKGATRNSETPRPETMQNERTCLSPWDGRQSARLAP